MADRQKRIAPYSSGQVVDQVSRSGGDSARAELLGAHQRCPAEPAGFGEVVAFGAADTEPRVVELRPGDPGARVKVSTSEMGSRRSPAHDPEGRRADVLDAARRLFAKNGYAQTSIRAIAAEACVNQALVVTYFGGKECLFLEAVGRFQIPRDALEGGLDGMGARIARAYMDRWENMAEDDPWLAVVRSALSHDASYRLLRSELEAQQTVPRRKVLGESGEGPLRSAMVECLIAGMIMTRYIYQLEPARSLPAPAYERAFAASLQHAINGTFAKDP